MAEQKNEAITTNMNDEIKKIEFQIRKIIDELYTTEANFLADMQELKDNLSKIKFKPKDKLHQKLKEIFNHYLNIADSKLVKPYPENQVMDFDYLAAKKSVIEQMNNESFTSYLKTLQKTCEAYDTYLDTVEEHDLSGIINSLKFKNNLQLRDHLVKPTQRMMKYGSLLIELRKDFLKLNEKQGKKDEEQEILELFKLVDVYNQEQNERQRQRDLKKNEEQLKVANGNLKTQIVKVFNSDYVDVKSIVTNLFSFEKDEHIPFGYRLNKDNTDLYITILKGDKFEDFRKLLTKNMIFITQTGKIEFEKVNEKYTQNKEKEPNQAAIWLGLIILATNTSQEQKLDAWKNLAELCTISGFCFNNDNKFIMTIIRFLNITAKQLDKAILSEHLQADKLDKLNTDLNTEVKDLKKVVTEKNTTIETLTKQVNDLNATVTQLQTENSELKTALANTKSENNQHKKTLSYSVQVRREPRAPETAASDELTPEERENKSLILKFDEMRTEINNMKGKWKLGFFGGKNHHGTKMSHGAHEILNILDDHGNEKEAKEKLNQILLQRIPRGVESYKKRSCRKAPTIELYNRLYDILNDIHSPNSRPEMISAV